MRIIGGDLRGSHLIAPRGMATRPTSSRVRESLFNILLHSIDDFSLANARVLDLFCGSGALGLEALSRGAAHALLIDNERRAWAAARENIAALRLEKKAGVWRRDAVRLGRLRDEMEPFDLVFLDPPYGRSLGEKALAAARAGGWLARGALCVLEERAGCAPELAGDFTLLDERRHGDTLLAFWRFSQADAA